MSRRHFFRSRPAAPSSQIEPMRFLRHLRGLLREMFQFARENKAWWIIPVVIVLLLAGLIIVGVTAVSPFVYSLF